MTYRMPAEWETHERTLIGWPCRPETWGDTLTQGRLEFAQIANTLVEFEPVTMVFATKEEEVEARPILSEKVDRLVVPMNGSWLRDNGPIFVRNSKGHRLARHFTFNAYGERHKERDKDARLGKTVAERLGFEVTAVDVVLEGGAFAVDGSGTLVAPEGCVLHPTRNWFLTKEEVTETLKATLGIDNLIWIPQGLAEDMLRDDERHYYGTDGHIDLFFAFIAPKECLMLSVKEDSPNLAHLHEARDILRANGIVIHDFPYMSSFEAKGDQYFASYLNYYVCNGAVLVPIAESEPDLDQQALQTIQLHWPEREVIGIPMRAGPMQGGAIHCLTQQVPAAVDEEAGL